MKMTPRERADTELQALHVLFRYADHQDARVGRYAALVRRLERRVRVMRWVGVVTGIAFTAWAALQLITYGQTGESTTLALGVITLLLAGGYMTYGVHLSGRYLSRLATVRALLDVTEVAPPAA